MVFKADIQQEEDKFLLFDFLCCRINIILLFSLILSDIYVIIAVNYC